MIATRRYSVILLVLLGFVIVMAGAFDLLREAGVFGGGLDFFGSLLIVVVGLWVITCGVECRRDIDGDRKS